MRPSRLAKAHRQVGLATIFVAEAVGGSDQAAAEAPFKVLFFVGFLLFMVTLLLNTIGDRYVQRVRQKY